jgi:hypothetical protein
VRANNSKPNVGDVSGALLIGRFLTGNIGRMTGSSADCALAGIGLHGASAPEKHRELVCGLRTRATDNTDRKQKRRLSNLVCSAPDKDSYAPRLTKNDDIRIRVGRITIQHLRACH